MKRSIQPLFIGLASLFFLTAGIFAQEKTEVTVQIKQDGKIVKDTTYRFDNEADAKQALKILEVMEGEGLHEMEFNYTMALSEGDDDNTLVFVSKDGEKTELKHMKGDSLVWVSEIEGEEGPVKVMKYRVEKGDHPGGEHVVVVTSGEGGTYDVIVDDGEEHAPVKMEKKVKVIVSDEENGKMKISEEEMIHSDQEVYVISGDDTEKELKEILEKVKEDEGKDEVKVIVIKKEK